jgi:hypothetical protein
MRRILKNIKYNRPDGCGPLLAGNANNGSNKIDIKTELSSHYGWINHLPEIHSKKIFNYAKAI